MKGLTHFISGVAAASLIPQVLRMSISSRMDVEGAASSLILVLAGMYGILPDTMILVNGQNVRHLQGIHTIVRNGADVALFPPGGPKEKARK